MKLFISFLGIALLCSAAHEAEPVVSFKDFSATESFEGKPAAAKINPDWRQFRTAIRYGAERGPNFAGAYTVVSWGCGTGCQNYVLVNAKTGKIYPVGNSALGSDFHKDSRLLILNPPDDDCKNARECSVYAEPQYFLWNGTALVKISPRKN